MKKKLLASIAILALGTMVFTGCGSKKVEEASTATAETNQPISAQETKKEGVKISIVGSTTVAEPMEKLVAKYKEMGNTDNLEVQGNGSSAGIKAAMEGTADIGMSSRELKEEEKASGIEETVIAYDGIAVVVHPSNGVEDLTKAQIKDIFEGKITNWSEVGGIDKDIVVVTREAGSGTRGAFEEILKLLDENKASTITEVALVAEGTGTVMKTVATKEASIGFVSEGFLDDTVKALKVDGTPCTVENVKGGTYAISRPLILVNKSDVKPEAKAVIDFILGKEGQSIMAEKYIPVKND
ncbi:phosphate-binding protein [Sporanaerobium hydrogeniformans]|uniref:Phosphate-binding protein n=1 Tax=Sporanaerobium hydrogeniformans TaxID=3072179 RepID=A0AC61DBB0_9FIRM|nr:phosphate ABC transporter substrate-binding protein [Sporanaerobium hydrogeniformans]PHV70338.1 phosphate-binding protein [Sporanaerobium hydrogeniformans]